MSATVQVTFTLFDKVSEGLNKIQGGFVKTTDYLERLGDRMFKINALANGFNNVGQAFSDATKPGMEFQSSMADLQAITGVTSQQLDDLGTKARATAKTFGVDGVKSVETYKLLLSQLTPELAKQPAALDAMSRNVAVLSKTMNGDAVAATEVLTTALNQYQVSMDDPIQASKTMTEMMNIMAAGAKEGSAELPAIKSALEQSGMAAKTFNVPFSETIAAIEVLDKAGKKGAEGGVALRNVMSILAEGRYMPEKTQKGLQAAGIDMSKLGDSSISLTDRLAMLKPVMNDQALMAQLFGRENMAAGIALVSNTALIDEYKGKIVGTNTAIEQANTIMNTQAEKLARQNAWWNDLKISVFNFTQNLVPMLDITGKGLVTLAQVAPALLLIKDATMWLTTSQKAQVMWTGISSAATSAWSTVLGIATGKIGLITVATAIWNAVLAINPIVWVIALIAGLVAAIVICWNKFEGFRKVIYGLWEVFKQVFTNIAGFFKLTFSPILDAITAISEHRWGDAAKAIGKGLYNLTPVGMAINAVKYASEGGFTNGLDKAWKKGQALGAASSKNNAPSEPTAMPFAGTPGISSALAPTPGIISGNQSISDGTKQKVFNINITKLGVDNITLQSTTVREGAQQIRDIVLEELIRVTQSAKLMV